MDSWRRFLFGYTPLQNVWSGSKSAVTFALIKILTHPCKPVNFGLFSCEKSKKKIFFRKKKFKMADSKKQRFSKSPILKIFSRKFHRLVLGLVGLNDAKGIDLAQRIWPWGCLTKAQKQPKSTEKAFFGCFWAFVGQPHGHIHWATSMPFASFNPTSPRTNLRNFCEKILRIGDFEKWAFFESAILNFFFRKKKKKIASFPWKSAQIYMVEWLSLIHISEPTRPY